jgi:hypothetical protein
LENASFLGLAENTPSPGNFSEWKKRNHVFTDMAALTGDIFALTGDGPPQQLEGSHISHNLFALLGVEPLSGATSSPRKIAKVARASSSLAHRSGGNALDRTRL